MICRAGESQVLPLNSGTYSGVTISAYQVHTTLNTLFTNASFLPQYTTLKVMLYRGEKPTVIIQDNLLVLGVYNALLRGGHEFFNGINKILPAGGTYHTKLQTVTVDFGGLIKVKGSDRLEIELTPSSAVFASTVDTTKSYMEFFPQRAIGYEIGIPKVVSRVVNATQNGQEFNLGDGVTKIAVLNFDQTDLANEVITTMVIQSDRYDVSMTLNQLLASQCLQFDDVPRLQYGTALSTAGSSVVRGIDKYPQSFMLFNGHKHNMDLGQCQVNLSLNSANVAASQNYVVYTSVAVTKHSLTNAHAKAQEHVKKNVAALPAK